LFYLVAPTTATPHLTPFAGSRDNVSYWDGAEVVGQSSIKINLVHQRAYFYKGDQLVGVSVVSTGREGYDTPSGEFRITQKDIDHTSNLYGDYVDLSGHVVMRNININIKQDPQPPATTFRGAPMPYFLRIHGGIGMHAGYLPVRLHMAVFDCLSERRSDFSRMRLLSLL
jgi:L,D-transpeptidase catalytic domain